MSGNIQNIGKKYFFSIIKLTFIFAVIFFTIKDPYYFGTLKFSILDSAWTMIFIILLLTIKLSWHLIRLKLVFWRIFLQTFLSTTSKVYKFFSHGYMVRIIAIAIAVGCSIKIIVFFSLTPIHLEQFAILYLGFCIFLFFKIHNMYGTNLSILRNDVANILKFYLMAFLLATATGIAISCYEIYNEENLPKLASFSDALAMTVANIDPNNNIFWRPIRIVSRHVYAYELLVQQLNNIPIFGQALYFIYLVISEGAVTFFCLFLMALPLKLEDKNGQA